MFQQTSLYRFLLSFQLQTKLEPAIPVALASRWISGLLPANSFSRGIKNNLRYWLISIFICILFLPEVHAHTSAEQLKNISRTDAILTYLQLGFKHIIPQGFDHILFILSLFLLNPKLKPVIWQATAFTVAHTITLGLAMYGLVKPPSYIIEPLIALSIMFVAIENIITEKLNSIRVMIVFAFGLVHGLGFANALN